MTRKVILYLTLCFLGCANTVDGSPSAHAFFSETTVDGRRSAVLMRSPNVVCLSVTLLGSPLSDRRELAIAPERHDRLVELADNMDLVDRYRVDARNPGSARECIEGTSTCYDPGIDLSPGPVSRLGDAAYVLYIPPEGHVAWTEETTEMFDTFSTVTDECLANGTQTGR